MADREPARFLPNHRSAAHAASTGGYPRWFPREAIALFELRPSDVVAFFMIADNLDAEGVSRTAMTLIAERGGISRSTAKVAVSVLVRWGLVLELDEKSAGSIMRYAIPAEMPWRHR